MRLVHAEGPGGELIEFQYHAIIVGPKGIEDPAREIQEKAAMVGGDFSAAPARGAAEGCFWSKDGFGRDRYCCPNPDGGFPICEPWIESKPSSGTPSRPPEARGMTAAATKASQGCGCG